MADLKFCEGCGQEAPGDARFCGSCRRPFAEPSGDEPTEAGPALAEPGEPGGGARNESELFDLRPFAIQSFFELTLAILTAGLAWLLLSIRRIDTRFWITTERIEITRGVINKRRLTIELFRVQDFELREPLFLRLRSGGSLVVRSLDPGEPEIILAGLPDAALVFETLRKITLEQRRHHRVRLLEGM